MKSSASLKTDSAYEKSNNKSSTDYDTAKVDDKNNLQLSAIGNLAMQDLLTDRDGGDSNSSAKSFLAHSKEQSPNIVRRTQTSNKAQGEVNQRTADKNPKKRQLYLWNLRNIPLTDDLIKQTASYHYIRRHLKASETEARVACQLWHGDLSKHSTEQRWRSRSTPVGRARLYLELAREWISDTDVAEKRDRAAKKTKTPIAKTTPSRPTPKVSDYFTQADYFEHAVTKMAWMDNGKFRLYYTDGTSLLLRWSPPPPVIDCNSKFKPFSDPQAPKSFKFVDATTYDYLKGFEKTRLLPSSMMAIDAKLRRIATTVTLTKDPASGKVYPSHINHLTAPGLCPYIIKAQKKASFEYSHMQRITGGAIVFFGSVSTATRITGAGTPLTRAQRGRHVSGPKTQQKLPPKTSEPQTGAGPRPLRGPKVTQLVPKTFVPQGNLPSWAEQMLARFKLRYKIGGDSAIAMANVQATGYKGRLIAASGTKNRPWIFKRPFKGFKVVRSPKETQPQGAPPASRRSFGEFDAEPKLLRELSRHLSPSSKGVIKLYVDKAICHACAALFRKFRKQFPNIRLIIYAKR